ncbi:hypothetical protein GGR54DRAFT_390625 [Hypoxylon sp. NC1633]|nr:hypothetical protein GGR54DRAFT_390625 [Hypoxylon sp. NC1633]
MPCHPSSLSTSNFICIWLIQLVVMGCLDLVRHIKAEIKGVFQRDKPSREPSSPRNGTTTVPGVATIPTTTAVTPAPLPNSKDGQPSSPQNGTTTVPGVATIPTTTAVTPAPLPNSNDGQLESSSTVAGAPAGTTKVQGNLPLGSAAKDSLIETSASQPGHEHPIVEPTPSQPIWHPTRPPLWNAAVESWRKENPQEYAELGKIIPRGNESRDVRAEHLFQYKPLDKCSKETPARLKRWLPALAAIRGIAMAVAATDPYRIAPIICASVFFSIDILLNTMNPEDRDKILQILFDCYEAIHECVSFEKNFLEKHNPAIQEDVDILEKSLPRQYVRALRLIFDIQHSTRISEKEELDKRLKHTGRAMWNKLTNKILVWDLEANVIKREKDQMLSRKKRLQESLLANGHITKVLRWIKKEGDPEPELDTIERRVMPDGRYKDSGQWFLDTPEFVDWLKPFQRPEGQHGSKRVLWIKGGYGTGKTTLLYHVNSALNLPEFHLQGDALRIIHYFCDASNTESKRPEYETIIRSLASRLSLLPNFTIAEPALKLHGKYADIPGQANTIPPERWAEFLEDLVKEGSSKYKVVFLVDALDECEQPEVRLLLKLMKGIMERNPNILFICSSYYQSPVREYFSDEILQEVEITKTRTKYEMEGFIAGELARRQSDSCHSIFYEPKHQDLLEELRKTLIKHADGMFRWVQVWLEILLPLNDDRIAIRTEQLARDRLIELRSDASEAADKRLESGYQRLWDLSSLPEFTAIRIRLFHLVLGSFLPLTSGDIQEALRIENGSLNNDVTGEIVERLYSNFLYKDSKVVLRFVHDSARKFVRNIPDPENGKMKLFDDKKNHLSISNLYIEVMESSAHPCWAVNTYWPQTWKLVCDMFSTSRASLMLESMAAPSFHNQFSSIRVYLVMYGLRHCAHAAEKRSMFDKLWTRVLNIAILSSDSAFRLVMMWPNAIRCPYRGNDFLPSEFIKSHKGSKTLLYSHVLAFLDIINEDDFSCFRLGNLTGEALQVDDETIRQQLLFKDAATRLRGRTALDIACQTGNEVAVNMILQATYFLSGPITVSDMFIIRERLVKSPLEVAIKYRSLDAAKTLLKFDSQHSITTSGDQRSNSTVGSYLSEQWSQLTMAFRPRPLLLYAIEELEERQVLDLLSIAQPKDINKRDGDGWTALDEAIKRDLGKLTQELVEKYGADVNAAKLGDKYAEVVARLSH